MTKRFGFTLAGATHVNSLQTNAKVGFTLAEVLITLGIIGVVAAMTIPTLIANTNGAKFRSQFKKTISALNQAGLMAQAQYDFDYAGTTDKCSGTVATDAGLHPESNMSFCAILNGTLTGQTYQGAVTNIKRSNNGAEVAYDIKQPAGYGKVLTKATALTYLAYTLADGSIVAFNKDAVGCEVPVGTQITGAYIATKPQCMGFIDVNGATLPNREVSCTTGDDAAAKKVEAPCAVKNDANHMTDIFPVFFHDATVEPASAAAKYVLPTSK